MSSELQTGDCMNGATHAGPWLVQFSALSGGKDVDNKGGDESTAKCLIVASKLKKEFQHAAWETSPS